MDRPRSLTLGAVAAATLAVAACGTIGAPTGSGTAGQSPAVAVSSSPPPSSPPVAGQSCPLSALKISIDISVAGVAAGSTYVPLLFDNISTSSCVLPSYPDVTFAAGAGGPAIGGPAAREDPSGAAESVSLAPGKEAHAWLQIVAASNFPPARCHQVTAAGLLITLSGASGNSFVADQVPACSQPPAGTAVLSVFPFHAGEPQRGVVP